MDENRENVPHLEIKKVILIHCNIASNDYQHDSRALCTFIPNKSLIQLLDISPILFLKTIISKFSYID